MQRITYLVDSENVNDAWLKLLPQLKRKDRILIFYTENSPHFTAESARTITEYKDKDINWVKCFTGRNALDFQMVSRLGYLICEFPQDAYVLMSNDNGFDAAVRYWMQEGIRISRIRGNLRAMSGILAEEDRQRFEEQQRTKVQTGRWSEDQTEPQRAEQQPEKCRKGSWDWKKFLFPKKIQRQEEKEADTLLDMEEAAHVRGIPSEQKCSAERPKNGAGKPKNGAGKPENSAEKPENGAGKPKQGDGKPEGTAAKRLKQDAQEAKQPNEIPVSCVLGVCRSIPIRRLERIHEALVALLGAEDGREVYHFLKDKKEFHEKLKSIYLADQKDRVTNYLQVVFSYHGIEAEQMEDITRILKKYQSGNFNGMYKAMTGSFGQKKGSRYYAVLKPHIRIIKKL